MGVAHGAVYYYFKSKEEILEALIQRHLNTLQAIMDSLIKEIYEKSSKELLVYQFKLAEELIEHVLGL